MTFQEMFENAKKALLKAKTVDAASDVAVQVNVTGEGSGIFYVKAADGALFVEPYDYIDNDAEMTVDSAVLLEALKKADTAALPLEGAPEKVAAFRAILESLPKPRKAPAKTAASTTKKAAPAKKTTAAAKTEAPAKAAAKTTTAAKKAAAPAKATAAKAATEEKKTTAAAKTTTAAKKTTKK